MPNDVVHFAIHADDAALEKAGGTLGGRHTIPTVGRLAQFYDPEGNVVMVMQYEPGAHG